LPDPDQDRQAEAAMDEIIMITESCNVLFAQTGSRKEKGKLRIGSLPNSFCLSVLGLGGALGSVPRALPSLRSSLNLGRKAVARFMPFLVGTCEYTQFLSKSYSKD
jgi:hypothetical protein